jgi:hypothetical protein
MSITSACPHCLAFFGTPLVIEPLPGQFSGDAGLVLCENSDTTKKKRFHDLLANLTHGVCPAESILMWFGGVRWMALQEAIGLATPVIAHGGRVE